MAYSKKINIRVNILLRNDQVDTKEDNKNINKYISKDNNIQRKPDNRRDHIIKRNPKEQY